MLTNKAAAEVTSFSRDFGPTHSLVERIVVPKEDRATPNAGDLREWQNISDYMTAARPSQLHDAAVFTGKVPYKAWRAQSNRVAKRDSPITELNGFRDQLNYELATIPAASWAEFPSAYLPDLNTVVLNDRSPGTLIHELGHAVDLQRGGENGGAGALWRDTRNALRPQLWEEFRAWRDGRRAYQQGLAASGEYKDPAVMAKYLENMKSYHNTKYPAYGTYIGGTLGTGIGAAAGLAGGLALGGGERGTGRLAGLLGLLGAAGGGLVGTYGGALAGRGWAAMREDANMAKAKTELQSLSRKKDNPTILKKLLELRAAREEQQAKKPPAKPTKTETRKAAALSAEERKRQHQKTTPPWLGLGLGAGAAGAYGLAQGIASDEQTAAVRKAMADYVPAALEKGQLPPNTTALTAYQKALVPAAQLKPFGIPVGDLLGILRSDPDLMAAMGTGDYTIKSPVKRWGWHGKAHYDAFADGPIPAYIHQMDGLYGQTPVPPNLGAPAGVPYADWMGRKLKTKLQQKLGDPTAPNEVSTNLMSNEQQTKFMEEFHAGLTPQEQAFRKTTENFGPARPGELPALAKQYNYYRPHFERVVNIRDRLKDIGIAGGGAAVGAIGGHMLYDILRDKHDKEKHPVGRALASAAGAGLGGAGAYFLGTDAGREATSAAIRGIKRRLLGLPWSA